jgi:hypothetical protein
MLNYVSFCLIIAHVGGKNLNFQKIYANIYGHYEHIQSPPTPSRKILFDPLKILPKWGENTPSQNLGLAGLGLPFSANT